MSKRIITGLVASTSLVLGGSLAVLPAQAADQPELYTTNVANQSSHSWASQFTELDGAIYFVAETLGYGNAIWNITDSNREPQLVTDISDGTWNRAIAQLTAFDGKLFFLGDDTLANDGYRPYVYDVANQTTNEITVVGGGTATISSAENNFVEVNGEMYVVSSTYSGATLYRINADAAEATAVTTVDFNIFTSAAMSQSDAGNTSIMLSAGDNIMVVENTPYVYGNAASTQDPLWFYDTVNDTWAKHNDMLGVRFAGEYTYQGQQGKIVAEATTFAWNYARDYIYWFFGDDGTETRLGTWSSYNTSLIFANYGEKLLTFDSYSGLFAEIDQVTGELVDLGSTVLPAGSSSVYLRTMVEINGLLVSAGRLDSGGEYLYTWDGIGELTRLGTISGPSAQDYIYSYVDNGGGSYRAGIIALGNDVLTNLYLSESVGAELYSVDTATGEPTLIQDMNTGSEGSSPDTDCFVTYQNLDYMTASLPLQEGKQWSTDVLLELKGEDDLLKYSVIDLGGISNPCGFAVGGEDLYFNGDDSETYQEGIYKMTPDRTITKLTDIEDNGDFGVFFDGSYYWTADNYYDSDLFVFDGTNVTQLTGQVGSEIEEDSVEELYLVGSSIFLIASEEATGDDFVYEVDLTAPTLTFEKVNLSINADPGQLSPRDLKAIGGKLYWADQAERDLYPIYSYDPETSVLTKEVDPAEAVPGFQGWTQARPFVVEGAVYGIYYDDSDNSKKLFRSTETGTELVAMPDGFDFFCAAPAGSDFAISGEDGTAYFYGDGTDPRLIPYSFSGSTDALCDAVTSLQGTYISMPEYPYSAGPWDTEPGYIGLLAPVAVERLGEPVNEPPSVPYSDDPTVFQQAAPGTPGTPTASAVTGGVKVKWSAPTEGGTPSSYVVTSSPAGASCTVSGLEAVCEGLEEGTEYTFSVRAINGAGSSLTAGPSNAITYTGGGGSGDRPAAADPVDPNLPKVVPNTGSHEPGDRLDIEGTKLRDVTKAWLGGVEVSFKLVGDRLEVTIPSGLTAGSYDLKLAGSFGTLIIQDYLVISGAESADGSSAIEKKTWTSINKPASAVRMIFKDPIGVGKVQFFHNDKEIAWIRAVDGTDPKLREAEVNGVEISYLVRTVDLMPNIKNAFEIYVDGERVWRAAYAG